MKDLLKRIRKYFTKKPILILSQRELSALHFVLMKLPVPQELKPTIRNMKDKFWEFKEAGLINTDYK